MEVAIARPSIVVGESGTGWTPAFNVLYWPLRAFARGLFDTDPRPARRARRRRPGRLRRRRHRRADRHATPPARSTSSPAEDAATVDELADARLRALRPRAPAVRARRARSSGAAVDEHGAVYVPYFDMEVVFDDARTRDVLGLRAPKLATYFDTLLDYADRAKWGKRGTPRDAARPTPLRARPSEVDAAASGRAPLRRLPVGRLQRAVPLLGGRRGGAQHDDGHGDRGDDEPGADREGERVAARQRARAGRAVRAAAPRCAPSRASPARRGRPPRRPAAWC